MKFKGASSAANNTIVEEDEPRNEELAVEKTVWRRMQ